MTDQTSTGPKPGEQVVSALKLVADVALLPGTGQLVEGKVREGVLYGLAGLTVKVISPVLLGPLWWVPWVGVGLDSFAKSTAGKHLWQLNQADSPAPVSRETSGIEP
jgi:hypothetical protein